MCNCEKNITLVSFCIKKGTLTQSYFSNNLKLNLLISVRSINPRSTPFATSSNVDSYVVIGEQRLNDKNASSVFISLALVTIVLFRYLSVNCRPRRRQERSRFGSGGSSISVLDTLSNQRLSNIREYSDENQHPRSDRSERFDETLNRDK